MRRLVAAASLAALGLTLVVPLASAHTDPNVHTLAWGADPNPTTANDGAQVYSNDEVIAAVVDFDDGVKSWDVVIRPVNGGQPSTCHEDLAQKDGKYPPKVYINCPWDTTRATNHTLPGSTDFNEAQRPQFSRVWQTGPRALRQWQVHHRDHGLQQRTAGLRRPDLLGTPAGRAPLPLSKRLGPAAVA